MAKADLSLRSRALAIVARREVSRWQLRQKLLPHAQSVDELEQVLNEFTEKNWQSDERFAEAYINYQSTKRGSMRLKQELIAKGVNSETIGQFLPDEASELQHAIAVVRKKFKHSAQDFAEKNKQLRFLLYRGFDLVTAQCALRQAWQEDDE